MNCLECGSGFFPLRPSQKFCSKPCSAKHVKNLFWERVRNNTLPSKERVCVGCGKVFTPKTGKERYHSKACASANAPKKIPVGNIKLLKCSVCGEEKRLYFFNLTKKVGSNVCRDCADKARYESEGLPSPALVLKHMIGKPGWAIYSWFQKKFNLSAQKTLDLVAWLVSDGYLRGLGGGRFVMENREPEELE